MPLWKSSYGTTIWRFRLLDELVVVGMVASAVNVPFDATWKIEIVPDQVGTKANFPDGSKVMA